MLPLVRAVRRLDLFHSPEGDAMSLIVALVILLILFGGGGFWAYPRYEWGGGILYILAVITVIILLVRVLGVV